MRDRDQTLRCRGQIEMRRAAEEPERSRDRRQRCAQLVTHGGDELVLQALYLLALADIDEHAESHRPVPGTQRIETDLRRELAAILAQSKQVPTQRRAAAVGTSIDLLAKPDIFRAQALGHEHIDRSADQLVTAIAEDLLGLGIDDRDLSRGVDHDDAARAGIDGEPEYLLRRTAPISSPTSCAI